MKRYKMTGGDLQGIFRVTREAKVQKLLSNGKWVNVPFSPNLIESFGKLIN